MHYCQKIIVNYLQLFASDIIVLYVTVNEAESHYDVILS